MAKAISNKNVLNAKFEVADFTGKWLASFGKPELCGAWIIFGESGSGKTHLALILMRYLSQFVNKAAYNSIEQGRSESFKRAWRRADMQEAGTRVVLLEKEPLDELRERLAKRKSPDVVVIDSITALVDFRQRVFIKLIKDFPKKLFIFIGHEKNKTPHPAMADYVRKLSDIKIRVEGYKAFVTTRFDCGNGEGGADFVIWEQGANEYWVDKF